MSFDRLSWIASLAALFAVAVGACLPCTASGRIGFQPISSEELKLTSEPQAPGAPAIVLFRQVDRDDSGPTSYEDTYLRIKILTEEGRKHADVEIPYFTNSGKIEGILARTIQTDGTVIDFEGKVFEKTIVKAKGFTYRAKTLMLPDVQVGGIIEYCYRQEFNDHYVYDSHWLLSQDLFTKRAQFSLNPYHSVYQPTVSLPFQERAGREVRARSPDPLAHPNDARGRVEVRWTWQGLPPGTLPPKEGPDHIIRLEAKNIPAFQREDFMPPEEELKARVDFTYSAVMPERDVDTFWIKTGQELDKQLERFAGERKAMKRAVGEIVAQSDSAEVKLRKIYARVERMRNLSDELQKTGQEEKRENAKPKSVEEAWKFGCGSSVQLTWLFLALVRAAGLESYGVWVSDRRNYWFDATRMESGKLDASVVLVRLNGKDVYLDPGSQFTPFGMLPWPETGVQGLRLNKQGGTWVRTPLPQSSESRIERKARLRLSEAGDLEGKLTITFTGLEAQWRRLSQRNVDEMERKQFLHDQVKQFIALASEVELVNKPDWVSSAPSLVAEFKVKIPAWASQAKDHAAVPVGLFSASEKHLFDHGTRVHAIYWEFPCQEVDDVTIELPPAWRVTSLPPDRAHLAHVVEYTLKVENDEGRLHLARKLNVDFLILETKYYATLRNFFQLVKSADEEQIILQPGETAASR